VGLWRLFPCTIKLLDAPDDKGDHPKDGGVEGDGAAAAPTATKGEETSAGAVGVSQQDGEEFDAKGWFR